MAPLGVSLAFGRAELVAPLVPLFLLHPPQLLPCLQPLPCLPVALLMRLVLWSMVHLVMVMVLGSKVLCVSQSERHQTATVSLRMPCLLQSPRAPPHLLALMSRRRSAAQRLPAWPGKFSRKHPYRILWILVTLCRDHMFAPCGILSCLPAGYFGRV
jgi:hypothetical protein